MSKKQKTTKGIIKGLSFFSAIISVIAMVFFTVLAVINIDFIFRAFSEGDYLGALLATASIGVLFIILNMAELKYRLLNAIVDNSIMCGTTNLLLIEVLKSSGACSCESKEEVKEEVKEEPKKETKAKKKTTKSKNK